MTVVAAMAAGLIVWQAGGARPFDIRSGPAPQSVTRLAAQAGIDVVITTDLSRLRTPAVQGEMPVEAALDRLLAPIGARAVRLGVGVYRIEAAPRPPRPSPPRPSPPAPIVVTQLSEVVVTAVPPVGLSGAGGRTVLGSGALGRIEGAPASDAIADLSATVDSTRLGAGRNKLFVRGLSDSAMNGPLQATVGQYLGDLRLSYGSPDPDLALVDIRRIEVFEGPQGTRFGAGSIGGVLRVQPQPPALGETSGRLIAAAGVTSGGAPGGDGSLVLNQPLGDHAAGRIVAYVRRDGGFLDNPTQGLKEQDGVETLGGRAALRWTDDVWTVDVTAVAQRVSGDDAQTVAVRQTAFTKDGRVLEPYESSVGLAGVTAQRRFDWGRLTSATSVSRQRLVERFDASAAANPFPTYVDRRQTATTAASELRLDMDPGQGWTWSGGLALALGETLVERRRHEMSSPPAPVTGADLRRTFAEAALFGEASFSPAPDWRVALGGRLSAVRIDSALKDVAAGVRAASDQDGTSVLFTPSVSARWDASRAATVFVRLEQAVRPAGVNEAAGAFERYQGDRVSLLEAGARTRDWRDDLSGEISAGWLDWRDVQADIVTQGGDMVTDNVGDGVIQFLSIKGSWRPTGTLDISGGLFLNRSSLTATRFSTIGASRTAIPNVAPIGGQLSIDHEAGEVLGRPLALAADFRYVGKSRLGVGPALDVPQGGYLRTELTARWGDESGALTLRISNPFNVTGTRYGIGSPYQLSEPQAVPLRPLTVRLGYETAF